MPTKALVPYSVKIRVTFPFEKLYNLKVHFGYLRENGLEKYPRKLKEEDECGFPLIE